MARSTKPRQRAATRGIRAAQRLLRRRPTNTALRLEALFGPDADFWLNLQQSYDLWHALHSPLAEELRAIPKLAHA